MQELGARHPSSIAALGFAALGVVFGDIGTSPLYTLKTVLDLTGGASSAAVLGVLSLIVWTLIAITSIKYVTIAMRIDNDGEGGILALMALLGVKRQTRPAIVALGLFGAALIYGDGAITPAISVLSALEGLTIAAPRLGPYVVPMAVAMLVVLFAIQSQGTARIGHAFGPVMAAWFVTIALLGVWGITKHPAVLLGLDPRYAISYLAHDGFRAFAVLGGVFLCVTGAEALYADMGHFGATPIRVAWSAIVFPSLVLNYAGQAAIVLEQGANADNIFYRLCPAPLLVPMIVLATVATVIASQSIITGAFSMTRQAIQLGWFPRLNIAQTSAEGYGQIYVGPVNWLLMVVTIALTIGFGKSDNLAAAYGIAVSATMLMTSALLLIAMREIWQWSLARQRRRRRDIPRHRCRLLRLQYLEDSGRRLRSAGARRCRVPDHVDLASRCRRRHRAHPREPHPNRHLHGQAGAGPGSPRARYGGVPHPRHARHAAGAGLARPPQPRPAGARARHHDADRAGALDRRRKARDGRAGGAGLLARQRALRIHGAAGYSAPAGAAQGARLHHRSRRRDVFRGTRDGDPASGRQGSAALAGRAVRLHGAQRLPRDGLF